MARINAYNKRRLPRTFRMVFLLGVLLLSLMPVGSFSGHKISYSGTIVTSAYNSFPGQTDSSPWITAWGTRCREGVIAANFLPFGTKVLLEGFGNQVFIVEDRMHRRYKNQIDVWFRDYNDAKKFGVRRLKYYVVESV